MKRRQLKKIVAHLSHGSPARFFYNEQVKAAWAARMRAASGPSPYDSVPRSRSFHWDINARGEVAPCDLWRWAFMFEFQFKWRIIQQTTLGDVFVSTVFLGTDMSWGGGRPILFESMVFRGPLDQEQDRYATREDALAGHADLVERCRAALAELEAITQEALPL